MSTLVVGCAAAAQSESKLAETTKINPPNFMAEALADFGKIGAIAPSSRFLTRAMLQPLSLETAKVAVELGPGTGVMTRALLRALPRDATLLTFEINERFTRHLIATVDDPAVDRHQCARGGTAERAEAARIFASGRDSFIAGDGLHVHQQRQRILGEASAALSSAGIFTQYQYLHCLAIQRLAIEQVRSRRSFWRSISVPWKERSSGPTCRPPSYSPAGKRWPRHRNPQAKPQRPDKTFASAEFQRLFTWRCLCGLREKAHSDWHPAPPSSNHPISLHHASDIRRRESRGFFLPGRQDANRER